jgi:uncharacterized protein (DUF305 family)
MSLRVKCDASKINSERRQRSPWKEVGALSIRKKLISLALISMVSGVTFATAQDQTRARHLRAAPAYSEEQEFVVDSELALGTMSLNMSVDPTGDVDHDFVAMMMPHHQGAIDVARAELKYGHNEVLRRLALSIIAEREREMSVMRDAFSEPAASNTPATSEHPSGQAKP